MNQDMLAARQMRIALFISFCWHLLWICAVSITFLPERLKTGQYPAVNFFGPILTEAIPSSFARVALGDLVELPAEADIQKFNQPLRAEAEFRQASFLSLSMEKEDLDLNGLIDIDSLSQKSSFAASFNSVKVKAKEREIVFQPPYPKFPEWPQQKLTAGSVIFRIYVLPDGLVQQVVSTQSSGEPELDAALARYVRKWRFAPSLEQAGQWQTVKIDTTSH